ncbi:MAG: ABC transporter permease [Bacteroidota bacterium]
MFINYIKTFWRSLIRQKLTSSINILGLAIGIACASMAYLFIQHERSFDNFHEGAEEIQMLRVTIDDAFSLSATPGAIAPALEDNFPEVVDHLRLLKEEIVVAHHTELFKEEAMLVESNFFDFFSFPLLQGDASSALTGNNVVLSEAAAQKYFGSTNPIGQSLAVQYEGEERPLTVSAIAADAPSNSSIQFDILLPLSFFPSYAEEKLNTQWGNFAISSFIRLRAAEDLAALREKLPAFIGQQYEADEDGEVAYQFFANPFVDYRLNGMIVANGLLPNADTDYVFILGIIALMILLVACLNFTNLSNARGTKRLTEVGVRQVLGAGKEQLRRQFLAESVFTSLVALLLAVVLVLLSIRYTNSLFDYTLSINWASPLTYLPLIGITVLTGLLAGAYPSILLSKLKTIKTFQSNYKIGGNNLVTKVGLVFQFTLSIGLLACTFIMLKQQRHLFAQDLGFDSDAVIVVPTQITRGDSLNTELLLSRYKNELASAKGVRQLAGTSYAFTQGNHAFSTDEDFEDIVFAYKSDPNYLDVLDIELLEGRNFRTGNLGDINNSVIVNETFKKKYMEGTVGNYKLPEEFEQFANATVIGVVQDHHFLDLRQEMEPMLLHQQAGQRYNHFLVKIGSEEVATTLGQLESAWQTIRPGLPFEFSFLDEDLQSQYEEEAKWNKVISGAALLAILIGFLGLFGLVALSLSERTKEIGIRKVMGASVANIIALFSKDFMILVGIAFVIATPIAYYFMNEWLQDFAYRIELQWWVFALAGLAAIGIALLTVSVQSVRAALANPVNSLRSE